MNHIVINYKDKNDWFYKNLYSFNKNKYDFYKLNVFLKTKKNIYDNIELYNSNNKLIGITLNIDLGNTLVYIKKKIKSKKK